MWGIPWRNRSKQGGKFCKGKIRLLGEITWRDYWNIEVKPRLYAAISGNLA